MKRMGLEAIYPKPNLSKLHQDHKKYPYLMRSVKVDRSDQAWAADITYILLQGGFAYLFAIIDWYSRFILELNLTSGKTSLIFANFGLDVWDHHKEYRFFIEENGLTKKIEKVLEASSNHSKSIQKVGKIIRKLILKADFSRALKDEILDFSRYGSFNRQKQCNG